MLGNILFLVFLIFASALFSSSETAFTSLTPVQVRRLEQKHGRRGKSIARLTGKPEILITTILVGNNLANIGATAMATQLTIEIFGSVYLGLMTGLMTLVMLIFAEVTPKQFAIYHNESLSLLMEPIISVLCTLFRPVTWAIGLFSNFIVRLFGGKKRRTMTLEGLLQMVTLAENLGIVKTQEEEMVKSVFRINETPVSAVMTHRTEVFSLEESCRVREVVDQVLAKGFSRIPLYKKDPEEISGILLSKDLMEAYSSGDTEMALRDLSVDAIVVPETKKVNQLFSQMRKERLNIAIILDEYGGLAGIASREDLIEEILGELYDEDEEAEKEKILALKPNVYRILGDTPFYLLEDRLDLTLPHGKTIQTLGGYIIEQLGRIPERNEVLITDVGRFVVESINRNRVKSVKYFPKILDPLQRGN